METKKKTKYHNKKTVYDGIKFDSQSEVDWYKGLRELEAQGKVSNIEVHKRVDIVALSHNLTYEHLFYMDVDFVWVDSKGVTVYQDIKQERQHFNEKTNQWETHLWATPEWELKAKIARIVAGIDIEKV